MASKSEVEAELRARTLQLTTLAELGESAAAGIAPEDLLERAVQMMPSAFPADRAAVLQLLADGSSFVTQAGCGWRPGAAPGPELAGLARMAIADRDIVVRAGVPSGLAVPIGARGKPWGVLALDSSTGATFTAVDATALRAFANLLGGVTRRLRTEQAMRQSETDFATVIANVSDMIVMARSDGTLTFASPSAEQMIGFTPEEMYGHSAIEFIHPDDVASVEAGAIRAAADPGVPNTIECRLRHRNGTWRLVDAVGRGVRMADGRFQFVVIVRDVTERREAEALLHDREAELARQAQLFNEVQAAARIGGWELTLASGAVHWTDEMYRLHETSAEEYVPTLEKMIGFYVEGSRQRISDAIKRAVETGSGWDLELEIVTARGNQRAVRIVGAVEIVDGTARRLYGAFQDVTERRELEEQYQQAQKMEVVGQLAGGVAHDFNNVLTVIQGHASLLETPGAVTSDLAGSVQEIRSAADRAARLTRQLLVFSRRQGINARVFDLNEVVGNVVTMLRRIVGEDVRTQLQLTDTPAMVHADSGMIEQVIMNLATNARDAMPRGGRLLIETATIAKDSVATRHPVSTEHGWVCLRVTDTGEGIPPELQPRIFDPFFTTKEAGKGTGLGLANVRGIAQRHGGWVEVESEPGRGTSFRIYLPGAAATPRRAAAEATPTTVRRGSETILLVEDEAPLRALGRMSLERLGYRVLDAKSAVAALVIWDSHRTEVSLLLTDVVLPGGMTGVDLAQRLRFDRPELRVVCMSGYNDGTATAELERHPNIRFLPKPFTPADLAEAVGKALDAPSANVRSGRITE